MYYLKSYLQGDALKIVQILEISENNYDTALQLLNRRFKNKKIIINSHLKTIFELPTITKESPTSLRHFLDVLQKDVKSLENLGEPINQCRSSKITGLGSKLHICRPS